MTEYNVEWKTPEQIAERRAICRCRIFLPICTDTANLADLGANEMQKITNPTICSVVLNKWQVVWAPQWSGVKASEPTPEAVLVA